MQNVQWKWISHLCDYILMVYKTAMIFALKAKGVSNNYSLFGEHFLSVGNRPIPGIHDRMWSSQDPQQEEVFLLSPH